MKTNLNQLAETIHGYNEKWWCDLETGERVDRNRGELLMLVVTELAEAVEGIRKDLMDDHLPHRKMEEVEMADAVIRLLDFAGGFGMDLDDEGCDWDFHIPENKAASVLQITKAVYEVYDSTWSTEYATVEAIRHIEAYCEHHKLDLWTTVDEKVEYNRHRADHQVESRKAEGGKKF